MAATETRRQGSLQILLSDGGLRDPATMSGLTGEHPELRWRPSDELPPPAKKAACWASLGYFAVHGVPGSFPEAAGAGWAPVPGNITPGRGSVIGQAGEEHCSHRVSVPVTVVWSAPDAVTPADQAATTPMPDYPGWVAGLHLPRRHDLLGRVVTHALFDEPAVVVERRGGWCSVVLPGQTSSLDPRGYPGWIPESHLTWDRGEPHVTDRPVARYPHARLHTEVGGLELSYGTRVRLVGTPAAHGQAPACGRRQTGPGQLYVGLPGGGKALIDEQELGVDDASDGWAVVREAERFLGLPYLWGGLSSYGCDCSGLTCLVHRRLGLAIPRDAHDQAASGLPVPPAAAVPGDLIFFARPGDPPHHVGIVCGPKVMLHAPQTGSGVELSRFDQEPYAQQLSGVRRYAGWSTVSSPSR